MPVGIEQHLMRLQRIGPDDESPAVRQFGMRNLQFDALTTNRGPIFAPVELECFARLEDQRHKRPVPRRLLSTMPISAPRARKCCDPLVRSIVSKLDQIFVHSLNTAPLLTRLTRLGQKPRRQPISIRVQLAWPRRCLERRFGRAFTQVLPDGVARQTSASRNLSYRHFVTQCPASYDTQKSHFDHSMSH